MRYRSAGSLGPEAVGNRVTIRRRLAEGGATDVVGTLLALDEDTATVRDRHGNAIRIDLADVVAARVILPPRR